MQNRSMLLKKKRKSPDIFIPLLLLWICFFMSVAMGQKNKKLMIPPVMNGGLAGLWECEHKFIEKTYGEFELLNFGNVDYSYENVSLSSKTWKLFSMGNYTQKKMQFATLARLKNYKDKILLIVFEWNPPQDTTCTHGVLFHSLLSESHVLIRTAQALGGCCDTIQISCADRNRLCATCYYNSESGVFKLDMLEEY